MTEVHCSHGAAGKREGVILRYASHCYRPSVFFLDIYTGWYCKLRKIQSMHKNIATAGTRRHPNGPIKKLKKDHHLCNNRKFYCNLIYWPINLTPLVNSRVGYSDILEHTFAGKFIRKYMIEFYAKSRKWEIFKFSGPRPGTVLAPAVWIGSGGHGSLKGGQLPKKLSVICTNMQFLT